MVLFLQLLCSAEAEAVSQYYIIVQNRRVSVDDIVVQMLRQLVKIIL